MINPTQLANVMGCSSATAIKWCAPLNTAMDRYSINTPLRQAHFFAQIGHESASLYYVREIASGRAYEGRKDLGNTQAGDGMRYKGRGLIQITGRNNYADCGKALNLPLIDSPILLEQPEHAAMSAAWFWHKSGLNELADKNLTKTITKRINGGYNGLDDRIRRLTKAKMALGIA
jgi:putative chitinase